MESAAVADLYRRLAGGLTATVEAVDPSRWDTPSPCAEWTVREVLGHVVQLHESLLDMAGQPVDVPSVADEPVAAWTTVRDAAQGALDDPEVATREFDSQFAGVTSLERIFGTFGAVDMVVHRWDVAHGAGVDDTLPAGDLALVWDFVQDKGDMMRQPGGFGPEVEVADDAGQQERVLAFLGRAV